jgi:hypothetical protein
MGNRYFGAAVKRKKISSTTRRSIAHDVLSYLFVAYGL